MKKKAQIKMGENMVILFIFFLLVGMAFIFYGKFSKQNIEIEAYKYDALKAIKVSELVASLPEVRCSEENIPISGCFDLLRVEAANQTIHDNQRYYLGILSFSKISIEQIYPEPKQVVLYDRKPSGKFGKTPTPIPISIYNSLSDTYTMGILNVELYDKAS
ncbi:hypothetical protein ACFLYT_00560 [Nanoarchaeota archaeon]